MSRFRITVAYDGTDFVGWQRQAAGVSIQGLLEDALAELDEAAVAVLGAGRTDAGVHALGQVAAFTLTRAIAADAVVRALNVRLPLSVRVLEAEEVPDDFHPQFAATSKTYRYRIWNSDVVSPFERLYAWHVFGALDVAAMSDAARMLEGIHDFAAFQGTGSDVKTTERTVFSSLVLPPSPRIRRTAEAQRAEAGRQAQDERKANPLVVSVSNHEPVITYEVCGTGFLRHMVRAIVGTLVEIGRGRRPPEWIREVVASRTRSDAGATAPAAGLFLVRVDY
jgi:tRNA pseudouridine38-40 synthase